MNKSKVIVVAAVFALLALLPQLAGKYEVDLITKVMIFAVFALSLELLVGSTGLVCFGQAAFFGIGAYAAVLLSPQDGSSASLLWLLPASVLAAALYALFVGALSLRTKGVYFIMVTLAFAQMAYYVVHDTSLGGGTDGIYLNSKPLLGAWLDLDKPLQLYHFTLVCLLAVFAFLALLLRSRFGRALAGNRFLKHPADTSAAAANDALFPRSLEQRSPSASPPMTAPRLLPKPPKSTGTKP